MQVVTLAHPNDAVGVDPIAFYRVIRTRFRLKMGEAMALLNEFATHKSISVRTPDREMAEKLVEDMTALRVRCTVVDVSQ